MRDVSMTDWPDGYGRVVYDEVSSTLDAVKKLSATQAPPFWLLAHRQTAPRGRRGRAWAMPEGNFAATLVMATEDPPPRRALRSFIAALSLYRACAETTGQEMSFSLKWPNDVLLDGGKVAGILLENGARDGLLSIGIGVNLKSAPDPDMVEPEALRPVSVAQETGVVVTPTEFLGALARHFAETERQFQQHGFEPIRLAWLAKAARLGEVIEARTMTETFMGTFEDVDAEGHLVLRGARGVTTVAAADVYF